MRQVRPVGIRGSFRVANVQLERKRGRFGLKENKDIFLLPKAWRSFYVKNRTLNKEGAVDLCPICTREFSEILKESGGRFGLKENKGIFLLSGILATALCILFFAIATTEHRALNATGAQHFAIATIICGVLAFVLICLWAALDEMERRPWASYKYGREYRRLKRKTAKKLEAIKKAGFTNAVEAFAVSYEAYNFAMSAALMGIPADVAAEDLEKIKGAAK